MSDLPLPIVRTSERSLVNKCPQAWWWAYRMGLVPIGEVADALWLGLGVHEAFAQWYLPGTKRGEHPAEFFSKWAGSEMREIKTEVFIDEELVAKYEDATDLGCAMLENYIDEYGKDPSWHVISTEHPFEVTVKRAGKPIATFSSRWDGVYRDLADGRIKLMEHKTAKAISTAYLELDDQGGAYFAVADSVLRADGTLGPKEHIKEITYNFLRKSMGDDRERDEGGRYLNKDGTVSKRQPQPLFVRHPVERTPGEVRSQLERLEKQVIWMNAMRMGDMPVVKHTTKDCPWCPFFDMCKAHEHGNDSWLELADSMYLVKDPYLENRKAAL